MGNKDQIVKIISGLNRSEKDPVLVSVDGMCASGKTTLGSFLQNTFDCNLFHMDDFFLQEHMKTPQRLGEVGGNADYERFMSEVITPLINRQSVLYRPYSCKEGKILGETEISYKKLNVIEGAYSGHPYFGDIYSLRIFTEIPPELQIERIAARNGKERLEEFKKLWIPKENEYFEKFQIKEKSITISTI